MPTYNVNWIYIGEHADMDPGEPAGGGDGFYGINNPNVLAGQTWSNADSDTSNNAAIIAVAANDANSDGNIYDGDVGYEHVGYTPPGGIRTLIVTHNGMRLLFAWTHSGMNLRFIPSFMLYSFKTVQRLLGKSII